MQSASALKTNPSIRLTPKRKLSGNPDIYLFPQTKFVSTPGERSGIRNQIAVYDRMMLDDRVSQAIGIVNSAIKSLNWRIDASEPDIAQFVRSCLADLQFKQFVAQLLEARVYGYSVFEEIWAVHNGKYRIVQERLLPCKRVGFRMNEFAELTAVVFDGEPIRSDWFHIFTYPQNKPESFFYGISDLQKIVREWQTKETLKRYRNIGLENFAFPLIVAIYDENVYRPDSPEYSDLMQMLEGIKDDARIALPAHQNPQDGNLIPGVTLKFLEPDFSGGGFTAFEQAIESENKAIDRSLGLPDNLGFTETGSGSYAKAQVEFDIFWRVVTDIAEIVQENIQTLVDRLMRYNYPDQTARFEFDVNHDKGISENKAKTLELLKNSGIPVSRQFIRRYLDLSESDLT